MAIEDVIREMVQSEVNRVLAPMRSAMQQMAAAANTLASVGEVALGGGGSAAAATGTRRRGRPPGRPSRTATSSTGASTLARRGPRPGRPAKAGACAIIGCGRPQRSKGYCAAHYQKRRNLEKSGRLPASWTENAAPGTVEDLKLPRGRAAQKAKTAAS